MFQTIPNMEQPPFLKSSNFFFKTIMIWCPQQESNLHHEIRNLEFYPLNYEDRRLQFCKSSDNFAHVLVLFFKVFKKKIKQYFANFNRILIFMRNHDARRERSLKSKV